MVLFHILHSPLSTFYWILEIFYNLIIAANKSLSGIKQGAISSAEAAQPHCNIFESQVNCTHFLGTCSLQLSDLKNCLFWYINDQLVTILYLFIPTWSCAGWLWPWWGFIRIIFVYNFPWLSSSSRMSCSIILN